MPTAERLSQPQRRNYHENIVEHYENPRNVGSLDKNSDDVGTVSWLEFSRLCFVCRWILWSRFTYFFGGFSA